VQALRVARAGCPRVTPFMMLLLILEGSRLDPAMVSQKNASMRNCCLLVKFTCGLPAVVPDSHVERSGMYHIFVIQILILILILMCFPNVRTFLWQFKRIRFSELQQQLTSNQAFLHGTSSNIYSNIFISECGVDLTGSVT
jgi:hypothetical protein